MTVRVLNRGGGVSRGELLYLRPWTVRKGIEWVRKVHRHLPRIQGAMWCVCLRRRPKDDVVGAALVGHAARLLGGETLAVLRVAVRPGVPNGCSMLYGACSRAARAMGARDLVTYTRLDEPGTSLKASGWVDGGLTEGGEHDRPSRRRAPARDPRPKRRWWAPWGERAQVVIAKRAA